MKKKSKSMNKFAYSQKEKDLLMIHINFLDYLKKI